MLNMLIPWWGRWAALLALIVATSGYSALKMHLHDNRVHSALVAEFAAYKAMVAAEGQKARQAALLQASIDLKAKEKADETLKSTTVALDATVRKLRDATNRRSYTLPAAPASSSRPDLYCANRAEFEREMGNLDKRLLAGSRGLADEGSAATVRLRVACDWAAGP